MTKPFIGDYFAERIRKSNRRGSKQPNPPPPYEYRDGVLLGVNLPLPCCPTMNQYAKWAAQPALRWLLAAAHEQSSKLISTAMLLAEWHRGGYGQTRLLVVGTRHSSKRPDDMGLDAMGGKVPVDALVKLGVLVDDNEEWCEREQGRWVKAKPRHGYFTLEVLEVTR